MRTSMTQVPSCRRPSRRPSLKGLILVNELLPTLPYRHESTRHDFIVGYLCFEQAGRVRKCIDPLDGRFGDYRVIERNVTFNDISNHLPLRAGKELCPDLGRELGLGA